MNPITSFYAQKFLIFLKIATFVHCLAFNAMAINR